MRKLLLATVAALGASMGVSAVADAQTASPAPGTVTVRLNGRFRFYGVIAQDRDVDNNASGTATGTVNAAGQGTATGRNKQTNYGFGNYARLYPGFDGVASNGLRYGASLEIRQDQASGAGGGQFGGISASNRSRAGLYFRREWGYIGTNQLGTIRFGNSDQPTSLYMTGNFENFNDGGLNGDVPQFLGNSAVTWPFADVGNYYGTTKVVYLSPQLYGLDFGVSFEPSTAGLSNGGNCGTGNPVGTNFVNASGSFTAATGANGQGVSGAGCDRLSSSPSNAESGRRRNTVDVLLRYRGTFGGFGIAATGAYIRGSNVKDNATGVAFNSNPLSGPVRNDFDGLNVGDFGVALTYAGFSVGGKYQVGRFNGQWALAPKGVDGGEAFLGGASYTIGPVVMGAHYLNYKSAGDVANAVQGRQRREQGIAAGATYSIAPGLSVFASYLWNERRQNGFNFVTGQGVVAGTAPGGNAFNNKLSSHLYSIGTSFSW
ncbi:MAG: porin [Gemmatimonadaceae bacterium]|nr:porin [Acetobacteraceae bacterium]